ncbi:MAG: hypothetical protein WBB85_06985 [Albidovulum sp.]
MSLSSYGERMRVKNPLVETDNGRRDEMRESSAALFALVVPGA